VREAATAGFRAARAGSVAQVGGSHSGDNDCPLLYT